MPFLFSKTIMTDANAADAVSSILSPSDLAHARELTIMAIFDSGVNAGAVQLEIAHRQDYTGVWSPIGTPLTFVNNGAKHISHTGLAGLAARVRIISPISGGNVSVIAIAQS